MSNDALQSVIAENIRKHAQQKNLSLDALADFAGVSRRQLYNFLAGTHDVTIGWLAKIADALGVEAAELLRRG